MIIDQLFTPKRLTESVQDVAEAGNANSGRRGPNSASDNTPVKHGRVEKIKSGIRHHADPSRYGGSEPDMDDDQLLGYNSRHRLHKAVTPDEVDEQGLQKFSHKKNRFRSLHKLQNPLGEENDPKRDKAERMIWKYFGQIYDYGDDDGLNYLDEQGELWNQLMDKYSGEIDDIVAREPTAVLMQAAQELKGIAGDMKYELDEADLADPSRRGFLKKAAGAAAAGAAMSAAGPEIVTLVKGFAEQAGGMNGIQALKAMLKIATPAELYNMYDYYADSGIMEDAITQSDMVALDRAGYDDWSEFEEHCDENGVDPDDEFQRLTGQPLKVSRVDAILGQVDDTWSLEDFFDQYPEAMNIINPPRESLLSMQQLAKIDTAAKGANLPTPIVAMANAVAGLVRQIFKSNGQPLAAPQQVAQPSRATPALPAPTRPEFDMTPDLKQKEKVPVQRKGDDEEPGDPRKTIQLLVDVGALSRGVLTDKSGMITKEKAQELLNKYYDGNQDMAEGEVVAFSKNKIKPPHDITGDDVEYAWALKHRAGAKDKISYQHNGVTLHHPDGSSTFILGGHRSLFDRDHAGKLKFKSDLSAANRSFKMPTRSAIKNNIVDFKAKESQGVAEGEYDSRKPFGVRYKVFAGREGRVTTREYWTSSEQKLQRAVAKIEALDNFYEIDGYSYPKEQQGVTEGETSTPAIYVKGGGKYPGMTIAPKAWSRIRDIKDEGDAYFVMVGNDGDGFNIPKNKVSPHRIKLKNGMPITAKQAFMMFNGRTPDREQGVAEGSLNELSKDTLKSYAKKAVPDMQASQKRSEIEAGKAASTKDDETAKTHYDAAKQAKDRTEKRMAGISGAIKRVTKQGVAEGLTEMDKSQTPPGRDGDPRPGPDKEAKPISKEKMTKDSGGMLNRAFKDSHKKKDVKEGLVDSAMGVSLKLATPELLKMAGFIRAYIKAEAPDALPAMEEILSRLRFYSTQETGKYNIGALQNLHQLAIFIKGNLRPDSEVQPVLTEFIRIVKYYLDETIKLTNENNNPLMNKLRRAMVKEGRVKELADDLKTLADAEFMKKYGKAKAAIRADMKRVDETRSDYTPAEMADMLSGKRSQKQVDADAERTRGPNKAPTTKESTQSRAKRLNEKLTSSDTLSRPAAGASSSGKAIDDPDIMGSLRSGSKFDRLGKTGGEPEFDFRSGLVGGETEVEAEPRLMVDPLPDMQKWGGKFATGSAGDNRFTAPAGWRYVEKGEDPARYGSEPAAATSALPNLKYDPQSRTLKSADAPALDLSPKSKFKFDRTTQSQVPADGSGANANIDNATRDRARAYAAKQNAPAAAAKQKVDWKTIYALNKATIGSNPNIIKPRMQLNMPNGTIYMVQPGDTLTKIAAKQNQVNELSTEKLAQYKTAAARDARQADQEGDFKRGDKRFGGIVKATKKQFDNDAKQVDESRAARRALMARIVNHR